MSEEKRLTAQEVKFALIEKDNDIRIENNANVEQEQIISNQQEQIEIFENALILIERKTYIGTINEIAAAALKTFKKITL